MNTTATRLATGVAATATTVDSAYLLRTNVGGTVAVLGMPYHVSAMPSAALANSALAPKDESVYQALVSASVRVGNGALPYGIRPGAARR